MSKLIVEMEMPKIPQNCGECKFHKPLYHTQYCVLEGRNCAPWKTRKDWCPIKGEISEIELMHLEEERAFAARNIAAERKDDDKTGSNTAS